MGKIFEEMKKQEYWDLTYERMMLKENFNTNQLADIVDLYNSNYQLEVIDGIMNKKFKFGKCEKQLLNKIGTNKKRVVYIYDIKDRYILGGLYRVFSAYYKDKINSNVFSYKSRVKTLDAVEYLLSDKDLINKHGVKLDISAYFNSVNKENLIRAIDELTENEGEIRYLLEDLLLNEEVYHRGKKLEEYKSLVPGTPFSSFLANYILKDIDDFIVNELNITYARYSDDLIIFADTIDELNIALEMIKGKLLELGLKINESKYEWYSPGEEITYLGLKIDNKKIDLADNSVRKYKKKVKRACRDARKRVEIEGKDPYKEAEKVFKRLNHRVFKCYVQDKSKFGWAYYAFRYINTMDSISELDFYTKDRVRQLITGKNNSGNIKKVPDKKLEELGYVSLCAMFIKFKTDFDMYCDTVDLLRT